MSAQELKWYFVRTFSGHEQKVKAALDLEIKRVELQDRIVEVLVPQETVIEVRNNKKRKRLRNLYPGYVLIRAVLDSKVRDIVTNVPSLIAFVGTKKNAAEVEPTALREDEIKRILDRIEERKNIAIVETNFVEGDPVKVNEGPFAGFTGTVKEVNHEKQKVKVEVGILGRKTPVELDFGQIEMDVQNLA
jgi:transcription termination/antitermination protein NusG